MQKYIGRYIELTDAELHELDPEGLRAAYRELLAHHVAETTKLYARERGTILRMAGNIASGICAAPAELTNARIATAAVDIAREILAEIDRDL